MNVKEVEDTFTCDCGFSWQRGRSGKHECADGLRAKLAAAVRREEGMKAIVDVMGLRITELEQPIVRPVNDIINLGDNRYKWSQRDLMWIEAIKAAGHKVEGV